MKAKKIRAWAVVDRRGVVREHFESGTRARNYAKDCNISVRGPRWFVVPLTGTFTPPKRKRAAVRGRR